MNKNFFKCMLTFMMVTVLSIGFVSCSEDDELPKPEDKESVVSALVGTWVCDWEEDGEKGKVYVTFKGDGTGNFKECYYNENGELKVDDEYSMKYTYDPADSSLKIMIYDDYINDYYNIIECRIKFISSDKIEAESEGEKYTFKKQ